jgi:hypothetical protein
MDFAKTLDAIRGVTHKWPNAEAKLSEDKANHPPIILVATHAWC